MNNKIELLPAACIDQGIHFYEHELPFTPDFQIVSSEERTIKDCEICYADVDLKIEQCDVELIKCRTEYGFLIRAYRILAIRGLYTKNRSRYAFDDSAFPVRNVRGFVRVQDNLGDRVYVIDRWYESDKEKEHDPDRDWNPNLVAGLHLLTRPNLDRAWAMTQDAEWFRVICNNEE